MKLKSDLLAGELPMGSYLQSCEEITFTDGILSASCKIENPRPGLPRRLAWQTSYLRVPEKYREIANCDGTLTLGDCYTFRE